MSIALILYLAGSAAAIALLALLMHRLGQSQLFRFEDPASVRDAFAAEFPEEKPAEIDIGATGHSAIVMMEGGVHFGLARAMGLFPLARLCTPDDVIAVDRNGAVLRLHMRDYTDPSFLIELTDAARARAWAARLDPQREPAPVVGAPAK